ncbi:MAG TPA: isoprenylcysteine carboxylmethyltransferase family protein [Actinomycetota bacterium]|jgi:protein-S-isoprenylcysteine O-methyltransferase Ste14
MATHGGSVRGQASGRRTNWSLKALVGSGDKIVLATLPFVIVGVILNAAFPSVFSVGGPPEALRVISIVVSIVGVAVWLWSAALILLRVPRGELITTGPFAWVKHPIYTSVALLVIPWVGFLLDTWLGAVLGIVLYLASRRFAPGEEAELSRTFGPAWDRYAASVKLAWL